MTMTLHTIPAATLRRLLVGTLNAAMPGDWLPSPLNSLLLAHAADGTWTAASTDAATLAAITLAPRSDQDGLDLGPAVTLPDAMPSAARPPSASWYLHAEDAAALLGVQADASREAIYDPITVTTTTIANERALHVHLLRHGPPFMVRLLPGPAYPDWRRMAQPSAETIIATAPIHAFASAIQSFLDLPHTVALAIQQQEPASLFINALEDRATGQPTGTPRVVSVGATLAVSARDSRGAEGGPEHVPITLTTAPPAIAAPVQIGHYDPERLIAVLRAAAATMAANAVTLSQVPQHILDGPLPSLLSLTATDYATGDVGQWFIAPCGITQSTVGAA
ncbi:hypothetical protein [Azospirillum canadense]|uniref:hypothetical protein n=1 Tax=Azospirillum canadense TaxID=403962 RepID=UPI002227B0B7|nr:hypothetical protein [Azospirillum canadense]MCW2240673.1 hypothetical protein [Azospirillum canadense]